MKFENIQIKNFRNFKNINLNLDNKNVFFGLNDIGKTNFLYALRYVFDNNVRKNNLADSDFFNKQIENPIEIMVTLNISESIDENEDNEKIRHWVKGAIRSGQERVYIKLVAEYDVEEMNAIPKLFWGGNQEQLVEIEQSGYYYDLDKLFNVVYIDSYVDVYSLFKKTVKKLLNSHEEKSNDPLIIKNINKLIGEINKNIGSLSKIKELESRITPKYNQFRNENISISIKSEIELNGIYNNLIPYIQKNNDNNLYPTSGEGRKKLLVYSIYDLLSSSMRQKKINLFLIEEPENNIHRSIQFALSRIIFKEGDFNYLFVTTHSPYILYEMDEVNLVRIYSDSSDITSSSYLYRVPHEFESNRKMLNQSLSEAIFANKVLLVEGPSEQVLFEKVLSYINPVFESDGIFILSVDGVGFEPYREILNKLHIFNVIKTDNDLRKNEKNEYISYGFQRCNKYIGNVEEKLPVKIISNNTNRERKKLFIDNEKEITRIGINYNVYLSKVDLECDLCECLGVVVLKKYLDVDKEPVVYLKKSKKYHMVELIGKLQEEDLKKIYNNENFSCLKAITNEFI